ncbi:MAG: mobilization protein [Lachnospiraceae bacterium]|nr:mobilization protein [Lachnospiraceae bacterium]
MERIVDHKGRWRKRTIGFRVSEEEAKFLDDCVKMSGLSKQDYILRKLTNRDVVVQGRSPRVFKALREQMEEIYEELQLVKDGGECEEELFYTIQVVAQTLEEMAKVKE